MYNTLFAPAIISIHISGDVCIAKDVLREYCHDCPIYITISTTESVCGCVTDATDFGMEIALRNHPQCTHTEEALYEHAKCIAALLIEELGQHSATIYTDSKSMQIQRRIKE